MDRQKTYPWFVTFVVLSSLFGRDQDNTSLAANYFIPSETSKIYLPFVIKQVSNNSVPIIHIPLYSQDITLRDNTIFWFGSVTPSDAYIDVRVGYNSTMLQINLAIIDRLLWFDSSPEIVNLLDWDGATILLSVNGAPGEVLSSSEYRIDLQFHNQGINEFDPSYQQTYQGNGGQWLITSFPYIYTVGWRSSISPFFNDQEDDKGWMVRFEIPFQSLGLSGPPPSGSIWGLSINHYNKNGSESPSRTQTWPVNSQRDRPSTWGQIKFGLPQYTPPPIAPTGITTIQQGLNGVIVPDSMVGGSSVCGQGLNFWREWGLANYIGASQVNIQSQWDVSDSPCFSKYYITFPLENIPANKQIISATLTMYQFGNSNPSEALASMVQVYRIDEDWSEATINWNNAPQAVEYVSRTRVDVLATYPGDLGVPREWEISQAVIDAYQQGIPLRLVMYEADAWMHTGKYFWSSNAEAPYNGLPRLTVYWSD